MSDAAIEHRHSRAQYIHKINPTLQSPCGRNGGAFVQPETGWHAQPINVLSVASPSPMAGLDALLIMRMAEVPEGTHSYARRAGPFRASAMMNHHAPRSGYGRCRGRFHVS